MKHAVPITLPFSDGFSLIEVLITLVVLGFGLISLAGLQGTVLQETGQAKARTIAAQLAEEKLEDLRNFTVLRTTAGTTAYQDIGTNLGGTKNVNQSLRLASGSVTIADSNAQYNRSWTVSNFSYGGPNATAGNFTSTVLKPYPDFKKIAITVSWTDQDNQTHNIILNSVISAVDPAKSARVLLFY